MIKWLDKIFKKYLDVNKSIKQEECIIPSREVYAKSVLNALNDETKLLGIMYEQIYDKYKAKIKDIFVSQITSNEAVIRFSTIAASSIYLGLPKKKEYLEQNEYKWFAICRAYEESVLDF